MFRYSLFRVHASWKQSYHHLIYHVIPMNNPPKAFRPRYIDGSGVQRVCGGSELKISQHYPKLFGHTVAQAWAQHAKDIKNDGQQQLRLDLCGFKNKDTHVSFTRNPVT